MIIDSSLTTPVMTFGGSALCGFFCGYALKKILKWLIVIAGVIVGVIFLAIQYLISRGYIHGTVDWTKLGTHMANYGQHLLTQVNLAGAPNILGTFGIPLTGGLAIGVAAGLAKG